LLPHAVSRPAVTLSALQATEQFGLLRGVFLLGQNSPTLQRGEFFQAGKNVAVATGVDGRVAAVGRRVVVAVVVIDRREGLRGLNRRHRRHTVDADHGQARQIDIAVLAGKRRCRAAALLRHAADLVIERVVNRHAAVGLHRQAVRLREPSVAHAVLAARAVWEFQVRPPPVRRCRGEQAVRAVRVVRAAGRGAAPAVDGRVAVLALALKAAGADHIGLAGHQAGQFGAQVINTALEVVVEHVADHRHAALHPLAGAAEFGVAELGHAAVAVDDGLQHRQHGVKAKAVALGHVLDGLLACGGKLWHGMQSVKVKGEAWQAG